MLTWLRNWWTFRDVAGEVTIGASGDEGYLIVDTSAWFKRCIVVTVPRKDLAELAEMIQESED